MMKAVYKNNKNGQLSLEARMGCGFGACMGCSIKTKFGEKQICKDGPIFEAKDLL
jgi:dihydroorotate dehydrogenase electron transfer subunit